MNEKEATPTCGGQERGCPYFHRVNLEGGECRKKPPAIVFIPMRRAASVQAIGAEPQAEIEMVAQASFPPVRSDAWCGEHPEIQMSAYLDLLESALPEIYGAVQKAVGGAPLSGFEPHGKPS
jgi:hypothetical protein